MSNGIKRYQDCEMRRSKPWEHVVELQLQLQLQQVSRLERAQIALFEIFWQMSVQLTEF